MRKSRVQEHISDDRQADGTQAVSKGKLSLFAFFAMTASMDITIYNYPSLASAKFSSIFFALVGGLFWFLPTALISAEMASVKGWNAGGVFGWVGNAFHSERIGFLAVFFQWFQCNVLFVMMSYFLVGMIAHICNVPELNEVPWVKFLSVLIIFGIITLLQLGGTKHTATIAEWGFIIGVLCMAIVFMILAVKYLASPGDPMQITVSPQTFFPDFRDPGTFTIFATFILVYMGIESSGSHVKDLRNPGKDYPRAILMLVALAIIMDSLGSVTIAAVVPAKQLSFNAGIYQAFAFLMRHDGIHAVWPLKIASILIVLGVVAEIGSWVVGPSEGLATAADYGYFPKALCRKNKHGVPAVMLGVQYVMATLWAALLTFSGSSNMAFLIASTLTSLIYIICYGFMYAAYFKLIFTEKNYPRAYTVPGGMVGKTLVAVFGSFTSLFAFIVCFIPSSALPASDGPVYVAILVASLLLSIAVPLVLMLFHKKFKAQVGPGNLKRFPTDAEVQAMIAAGDDMSKMDIPAVATAALAEESDSAQN